jgi:hypothetical protein
MEYTYNTAKKIRRKGGEGVLFSDQWYIFFEESGVKRLISRLIGLQMLKNE